MKNLISEAVAQIGAWFNSLQIKQFLSVILVGFLLLNTTVAPDRASKATIDKLERMVQQEDSRRPKTTGEWQQQAREVKGKPGERLERIGEQSADAIKEFGSMYPDVAKKSANELEQNTNN
jgi:hypothetical protein